jgi:hypothetical protein
MIDLTSIKERCKLATNGPWTSGWLWEVDEWVRLSEPIGLGVVGEGLGSICNMQCREDDSHKANAQFIAHARTDIPALIAEVELLREKIAEIRKLSRLAGT